MGFKVEDMVVFIDQKIRSQASSLKGIKNFQFSISTLWQQLQGTVNVSLRDMNA
ncbi:hypothetical protein [Okeania sp.]|uniref:hypothetical protein n=1 Tax=Okeania sp. TaxID=3100323 RepID=UPI002B4ADDAB|nr:hypothetical protein [Okeania sp.]MEB3342263.1 hypothetical protein [Okeania sp.]